MSFGQDESTSMQGATGQFDTLLGGGPDSTLPKPVGEIKGKKPKGKSPVATFLGADAKPSSDIGRSTLLGAA